MGTRSQVFLAQVFLAATASPIALAASPAAAQTEGDEIIVTGSRIAKSEFTSADPIQIIDPETAKLQGQVQLVDVLRSTPAAQGSIQINSAISNRFVANGGNDVQTVSLRGLGAERTLVLINGRRAGPAGIRGAVAPFDLNVLPLSVVREVQVLKTGASSIYGSDAVAGVVNILTRDDLDGFEAGGFSSITEHGGGESYGADASFGKKFDRGHIFATVDVFRQQNLTRHDRGFLFCSEEYLKREADGSRADIVDFRTGHPACSSTQANMIVFSDFSGVDENGFPTFGPGLIAPNGQAIFAGQYGNEYAGVGIPINAYNPIGVFGPADFFGVNFDGPSTGALNQFEPAEQDSDVFSGVRRVSAFAEGAYDVTDSITAYGEFLFSNRKSHNNGVQRIELQQFTGASMLPFFLCDPTQFNCDPGDLGDPLNAEFGGNLILRPRVLVKSESQADVDYYRGVLGLRGDFGAGWKWDVHGQHSRSDASYTQDVIYQDAIASQTLRTRSCAGTTTAIRGAECIDIDFTDPRVLRGDFTPAERAFLMGRETGRTLFKQTSAEALLTGKLFTLPAGSVGVAFGANIRRDEIDDTPGEATLAGNVANFTTSGITAGHTVSKEVFGEVEVPLLEGVPMIERLTLSGAARYTHVEATSRTGAQDGFSDTTWKVGADWAVTDWLRFRGTWGTSFRAPALFELFLQDQTGFLGQQDIDPCIQTAARLAAGAISQRVFDNCAADGIAPDYAGGIAPATIVSGGGLGRLEPETSTAKTVSVILTPDLSGALWGGLKARLAVDYFDLKVRQEITLLGASNILAGCYDSDDFTSEAFCGLFTRTAAGPDAQSVASVTDRYVNISRQRNRGVDLSLAIDQDLGNLGSLAFRAQMTWQVEDKVKLFPGTEIDDNGTIGNPKWVGDFNLGWTKDAWTLFYGLDVIGAASNMKELLRAQGGDACRTSSFRPGGRFCPDVSVPATFYHSLSLSRDVDDRFRITLGVANLFDTPPPRVSTVVTATPPVIGQAPAFGTQYDYLGRRFFLGVRGKI
ncbi:TonB-dependent receptor domain-containing protein [Sphingopyxis sp. JAI108]|uniref:TonB-dependent receptor domain-containing protein n=1 Tax=Sphingopyxis sp. JAI108 TaxID=2723060 RepID=UPI0015CAE39F|nr:TonB-dependent receptor [Sphingopyxis sp. JAI108]NYF32927.1 iron complex outermembrane receptor protein [Sphingopyxis sp. JAI108]